MMSPAGKGSLACGLALAFGCSPAPSGAPKAGGAVAAVLPSASTTVTVAASGAAPKQPHAPPAETASETHAGTPNTAADPERSDAEKRGPPDLKLIESEVVAALKRASGCPVEARWKGWTIPVKITVSKNGHFRIDVGFVTISRPDDDFETLQARPDTECISAHFEMITIPPFDGEPVVLERKLKIR
jgi:hypothetical protein